MSSYQQKIQRGKADHGDKFSEAALSKQFIQYYNNQQRIKVQFPDGSTATGTVGATTGWVPAFLLKRRKTDFSSSAVLSDSDKIIAIKIGNKYRPIV